MTTAPVYVNTCSFERVVQACCVTSLENDESQIGQNKKGCVRVCEGEGGDFVHVNKEFAIELELQAVIRKLLFL